MITRIVGILIAVLILSPSLIAQNNNTRFFFAYEYENLTVDATAGGVPFTAAKVNVPTNPIESAALVTFSVSCASGTDCPARFTLDGTAPTSAIGIVVTNGMIVSIYANTNIVAFRAIRTGATSAIFNVQYFR